MEQKNRKLFFKEGDEVAHKENPLLKMEVRRIIRTKLKPRKEGEPDRRFTHGIECGWWGENGYCQEIFHTRSIVPYDVAQMGFNEIIRWLDAQQNIKV